MALASGEIKILLKRARLVGGADAEQGSEWAWLGSARRLFEAEDEFIEACGRMV